MSTTLATSIQAAVQAVLHNAGDLVDGDAPLNQRFTAALTNGTGAGQADVCFSDTRTVLTGATDSLDMAGGGLTDAFGNVFAPARIKAIVFFSRAANTTNLTFGGDANGVPIYSDKTDCEVVLPGGMLIKVNPSAAGWAVTAGTGDIVKVVNAAGASAIFDIIVIGASA